jgi:SPP1 gp7 family putative phage head morphogenesis protein
MQRINDRKPKNFRLAQQRFLKSRKAEIEYARKLRSIAKQVGHIVQGFAPKGVVLNQEALLSSLRKYAEMITPWAKTVAKTMLEDIARRDESMWSQMGEDIGRNLKAEIMVTPTGTLMAEALNEQVRLITSLPLEAAERVHGLVLMGMTDSTRAKQVAEDILATGQVTKGRANLIARTEVSRAATELTKARATQAGVTHYIWRTSGDSDVRTSHKHMNGKVVAFAEPPEVEPGKFYHAGSFPNCRCYIEPIISEEE